MPVATPTPDPALLPDSAYYPINKEPMRWHQLSQTGIKPLTQGLVTAKMMVLVMAEQLTDQDFIKALILASKQKNSNGGNLNVVVYLDDSTKNRTINQPAFDTLKAAGIYMEWIHKAGGTTPPSFTRMGMNLIYLVDNMTSPSGGGQPVYDGANFILNGPLTPEFLGSSNAVALQDADSLDFNEAFKGLGAAFNPSQHYAPGRSSIILSPGDARNQFRTAISGAKTSIDLAVESLDDAELITALTNQAQAGVQVRIVLPTSQTAQRDALVSAGITQVKLADDIHGIIGVVDGTSGIGGSFPLTQAGLVDEFNLAFNLTKPAVAQGASQTFEALWSIAQ